MANNKIPSLKKILPQSPDEIQKFSSESSAAVARMSHVNRAAQYFGMDAEFIEVDYGLTTEVYINKPCGHIKILNANIPADGAISVNVIWDKAVYTAAKSISTPCYVQITPSSNKTISANATFGSDTLDGYVTITIYSVLGTTDSGFFYSIVPQ